jgi:hypothetical protein
MSLLRFFFCTDGLKQDSHQAYADRYWPDLSGNMWPNSSKDASFVRETGGSSTNIFPAGFKLTTLVVMGTDCIGSCKSNYHMITTTSFCQ